MSEDYPLCPELTEQGEKEAQRIMDAFKPRLAWSAAREKQEQLFLEAIQ